MITPPFAPSGALRVGASPTGTAPSSNGRRLRRGSRCAPIPFSIRRKRTGFPAASGARAGRAFEGSAARVGQLLEGPLVEAFEQQADSRIKFTQIEELAVAQDRHNPALDYLHADFNLGFILGFARASRQYGDPVMLGQITVTGVDVRLVAMRFAEAATQVVRHQDLVCPTEKSESRRCELSQSGSSCDQVASANV